MCKLFYSICIVTFLGGISTSAAPLTPDDSLTNSLLFMRHYMAQHETHPHDILIPREVRDIMNDDVFQGICENIHIYKNRTSLKCLAENINQFVNAQLEDAQKNHTLLETYKPQAVVDLLLRYCIKEYFNDNMLILFQLRICATQDRLINLYQINTVRE